MLLAFPAAALACCADTGGEDTWCDEASGLCWQDPPPESGYDWEGAVAYCDCLSWDGKAGWRLPSISELRSLIRGCPGTQAGGECGVTDDCLAGWCWTAACDGCANLGGPGTDGCYWPPDVGGSSTPAYWWSSSTFAANPNSAWRVFFRVGEVGTRSKCFDASVRCVRDGP